MTPTLAQMGIEFADFVVHQVPDAPCKLVLNYTVWGTGYLFEVGLDQS